MSAGPLWFQKGAKPVGKQQPDVPHPGSGMGHVLPYVSRGGENWHQIERVLRTGGNSVKVKVLCLGCNLTGTAIIEDPALFDQTIEILCPECREDRGFAWASTLPFDQVKRYQIVKKFPDDTLMRLIEKSPNFKEEVHKPIDSVEQAVRSLTKKGQAGSIDPKDVKPT